MVVVRRTTKSTNNMEINFKGKKALVTGAGRGIGRDIAKRLAELGATTIALSRTQAQLDTLKAEVPSIQTIQCDLQDWNKTRETVQAISDIDILVNNAAVASIDHFLDVSKEDVDLQVDINFKAAFNVSQVVAKSMVARKSGGAIVNVSSQAVFRGLLEHAVYCATKAALDALTHVMALELGQHKIRVNSVNPTVVMTDMGKKAWSDPAKSGPMLDRIPLGRFAELSEVSDAVMYLLSDKASMIHGITLPIDGGMLTS